MAAGPTPVYFNETDCFGSNCNVSITLAKISAIMYQLQIDYFLQAARTLEPGYFSSASLNSLASMYGNPLSWSVEALEDRNTTGKINWPFICGITLDCEEEDENEVTTSSTSSLALGLGLGLGLGIPLLLVLGYLMYRFYSEQRVAHAMANQQYVGEYKPDLGPYGQQEPSSAMYPQMAVNPLIDIPKPPSATALPHLAYSAGGAPRGAAAGYMTPGHPLSPLPQSYYQSVPLANGSLLPSFAPPGFSTMVRPSTYQYPTAPSRLVQSAGGAFTPASPRSQGMIGSRYTGMASPQVGRAASATPFGSSPMSAQANQVAMGFYEEPTTPRSPQTPRTPADAQQIATNPVFRNVSNYSRW